MPQPPLRSRLLRLLLVVLVAAASAAVTSSAPARAADVALAQCNDVGAGPAGATTGMTCSVTVVNTIDGATRGSTVTVARQCSLDPCPGGNQSSTTTSSTDLVTSVSQCNGSGNDAAHTTTCTVSITNNISSDTPGASPVRGVTVNQCNGSAQGGGGSNTCDPVPATTTSADITQCNGSANGGGGTIDCDVQPGSSVSSALLVTVNQCNGTGNPGGSTVRCSARITTNLTAPSAGGTTGGSSGGTAGGTSGGTPGTSTGGSSGGTTGGSSGGTTGGSSGGTTGGSSGGTTSGATAGSGPGGAGSGGPVAAPPTAAPSVPVGAAGLTGVPVTAADRTSRPQVRQVPRGGVAAGSGSTAQPPPAGHHALFWLGALGIPAALLALRRRPAHR